MRQDVQRDCSPPASRRTKQRQKDASDHLSRISRRLILVGGFARSKRTGWAVGVIPRSGGADLWKHRALNRGREPGARRTREKKRENFQKKNKEKSRGRERRTGEGASAAGLRDPDKCSDKGDKARRCALQRDEQESLIAEGKRGRSSRGGPRWSFSQRKSPRAR